MTIPPDAHDSNSGSRPPGDADLERRLRSEFAALVPGPDPAAARYAATVATGDGRLGGARRWAAPLAAAAAVAALGLGGIALADHHNSGGGNPAAGSEPPAYVSCTAVPQAMPAPASFVPTAPASGSPASATAGSVVTVVSADGNGDAVITVSTGAEEPPPLVLHGMSFSTVQQAFATVDEGITDVAVKFTNGTLANYRFVPGDAWVPDAPNVPANVNVVSCAPVPTTGVPSSTDPSPAPGTGTPTTPAGPTSPAGPTETAPGTGTGTAKSSYAPSGTTGQSSGDRTTPGAASTSPPAS